MSNNKIKLVLIVFLLFYLGILFPSRSNAQVMDPRWIGPQRLSSEVGNVTPAGAKLAVDRYGIVHAFWGETGHANDRTVIQYARFDGVSWSTPVDVYATKPLGLFGTVESVAIDQNDIIHLIWSGTLSGPILYSQVPISQASSAQNWAKPTSIMVALKQAHLLIDSHNTLHLVYSIYSEGEQAPGLYYIQSVDSGLTWSAARRLDPGIPRNYSPAAFNFVIDKANGSLHITVKYVEVLGGIFDFVGKEVVYLNSLDGGLTWREPFVADRADETEDELRLDANLVSANEGTVHLIWAGDAEGHRDHRLSRDSGKTWSNTVRVFDDLVGSAGDSLFLDGNGGVHFLGQIRFPIGLWHIQWIGDRWDIPVLVYLYRVGEQTKEEIAASNLIHVHNVQAVVRAGNHVVATFTNAPGEEVLNLYSMHSILPLVSQQQVFPTPTFAASPSPTSDASIEQPAETLRSGTLGRNIENPNNLDPADRLPTPGNTIWFGVVSSLLVIFSAVAYRLILKHQV